MESFGIGGLTATGAAGAVLVLAVSVWRSLRRIRAGAAAPGRSGMPAPRLEALAAAQADLAARLDALAAGQGAPEERLQAMAGQLLGLVRDKNATLETALAGLDQLRARLGALEQMGEPAEAQALLKRLEARLEEIHNGQAASAATLAARIAALEGPSTHPVAELAERLTRLHDQKDAVAERVLARLATVETVFARLAPLETRLAELDGRLAGLDGRLAGLDPQLALDRFAERLEAVRDGFEGRLGRLEAPGESPFAGLSEQLAALYAQKDATVETVFARLAPLETRLAELDGRLAGLDGRLAGLDPQLALDRFAERLEAVRDGFEGRLGRLEAPGESPFAGLSEQLAALYAQKDATVETVFARLAPLETRLAELDGRLAGLDGRLAGLDPQLALDRFAERLEAVRDGFEGRLGRLEAPGESPFAGLSEQLAALYAQKDATVETVFARLAPLETRLAELDGRLAGLDPQLALDRFAERLEAVRDGFEGRLGRLEAPGESPFAGLSEQLAALYAQKDATVETVFARLAPLETRLAELDGRLGRVAPLAEGRLEGQVDGLAARIEALHWAQGEIAAGLAALKATGDEAGAGAQAAALAATLAAAVPFAAISEQLTALHAQKDAALATALARLAPLEARLAELEIGLGRVAPLAEGRLEGQVDGLAARIEALHWAQGEIAAGLAALKATGDEAGAGAQAAALAATLAAAVPFAAVSEQLTALHAQKDAALATALARLAPLEARLAELEARPDPDADDARAQAQAIAAQLIAARDAAEQASVQSGLFADRLAVMEASLPRLSAAQSLLLEALQARAAAAPESPHSSREHAREDAPEAAVADAAVVAAAVADAAVADAAVADAAVADAAVADAAVAAAAVAAAAVAAAVAPGPAGDPGAEDAGAADAGAAEAEGGAAAAVLSPAEDLWSLPRLISLHHRP